jgi:hypothetical protein
MRRGWSSAKKCVRLQSRCDSAARDVARNEADAGVVGDHQVAGRDPNLPDLHGAVDLHGLDPPLAGDRRDVARRWRMLRTISAGFNFSEER